MPCPARLSSDGQTLRHTWWGLVVGTKLGTVVLTSNLTSTLQRAKHAALIHRSGDGDESWEAISSAMAFQSNLVGESPSFRAKRSQFLHPANGFRLVITLEVVRPFFSDFLIELLAVANPGFNPAESSPFPEVLVGITGSPCQSTPLALFPGHDRSPIWRDHWGLGVLWIVLTTLA